MAARDVKHGCNDRQADHEASVWLVRLDLVRTHWPDWESVLTPEETAKANRHVRPADRFRSAATRALLRRLLGRQLAMPPAQVSLTCNRFGKPRLADAPGPTPLRFSISHSGEFALFGFAYGRPIGVDLEQIRALADYRELAGAVCNECELREIELLPEEQRAGEIFRFWVLKESYVKALGVGLSFPYQRVEIGRNAPAGPGAAPGYAVRVRGAWSIFPLNDFSGYAAAVVVAGDAIQLERRTMQWDVG